MCPVFAACRRIETKIFFASSAKRILEKAFVAGTGAWMRVRSPRDHAALITQAKISRFHGDCAYSWTQERPVRRRRKLSASNPQTMGRR
jgi:hypothetical protein